MPSQPHATRHVRPRHATICPYSRSPNPSDNSNHTASGATNLTEPVPFPNCTTYHTKSDRLRLCGMLIPAATDLCDDSSHDTPHQVRLGLLLRQAKSCQVYFLATINLEPHCDVSTRSDRAARQNTPRLFDTSCRTIATLPARSTQFPGDLLDD